MLGQPKEEMKVAAHREAEELAPEDEDPEAEGEAGQRLEEALAFPENYCWSESSAMAAPPPMWQRSSWHLLVYQFFKVRMHSISA